MQPIAGAIGRYYQVGCARKGGPVADDDAREAVREAYQAYYRRLVATLYGLTADYGEAQDLVQEAYARALARPKTFLDVADPEAWLRTVAVNLARTRWRRRRLLDTMIRTGRVTPTPESVPGANPNRVLLVAALAKLSRPTRETIVLHHIADMSVHEVAEQLGIPVGTVKARLSRGRALLAELLHEAAPTAAVPVSGEPAIPSVRPAADDTPSVRRTGILPARPPRRSAAAAGSMAGDPILAGQVVTPPNVSVPGGPNATGTDGPVTVAPQPRAADMIGANDDTDGLDRLLEVPPTVADTELGGTELGVEGLVPVRGRRR